MTSCLFLLASSPSSSAVIYSAPLSLSATSQQTENDDASLRELPYMHCLGGVVAERTSIAPLSKPCHGLGLFHRLAISFVSLCLSAVQKVCSVCICAACTHMGAHCCVIRASQCSVSPGRSHKARWWAFHTSDWRLQCLTVRADTKRSTHPCGRVTSMTSHPLRCPLRTRIYRAACNASMQSSHSTRQMYHEQRTRSALQLWGMGSCPPRQTRMLLPSAEYYVVLTCCTTSFVAEELPTCTCHRACTGFHCSPSLGKITYASKISSEL